MLDLINLIQTCSCFFCQFSLRVARWSPALGDAQMMSKRLLLLFTSRMNWTGTRTLARQSWLFCFEKDQLDLKVEHVPLPWRGRSGDTADENHHHNQHHQQPPRPPASQKFLSLQDSSQHSNTLPSDHEKDHFTGFKVCFPQTFLRVKFVLQTLIHLRARHVVTTWTFGSDFATR